MELYDIDVEITWRCQIGKQQCYHVPIVCDSSFKKIIDSFIQNGLNMMILYVSRRPKFVCVLTSIDPSNSVGRSKNSLLLDDLLQMTNDIKFDNPLSMFTCSCMLCRESLKLHTVC